MPARFTQIISILLCLLTLSLISSKTEAQKKAEDENIMNAAETSLGQGADVFIKAAKSARFGDKQVTEDDGTVKIRMTGRVLRHSKSYMVTAYRKDGDAKIHHIGIFLPEDQNWDELKEDYDNLKKQLSALYGSPAETSESFIGKTPSSNAEKMAALKSEATDFTTKFTHGSITILLSITYAEQYGAHVGMLYLDGKMAEDVAETLNGTRG